MCSGGCLCMHVCCVVTNCATKMIEGIANLRGRICLHANLWIQSASQPTPTISSSRSYLHSLNDTLSLLGPLKRGRMRMGGRVERLEWVQAKGRDKDESRGNRNKESENKRQREERWLHESQLLFSRCHLWYMLLHPTNLNGLPAWPDKLNQLKVFCPQTSKRTTANVRKRKFKVPEFD